MDASSTDYYRMPLRITAIGRHSACVDALPDEVRAIFQVVQGLLIHDLWLEQYGEEWRRAQACSGNVERILDKALQLDGRSLAISRSPAQRVIRCCRDFSLMLCAMLHHEGIVARCWCGFATYLGPPGKYKDRCICEYWNTAEQRWVLVDPQLNPFQQSFLRVEFSPLDPSPTSCMDEEESISKDSDDRKLNHHLQATPPVTPSPTTSMDKDANTFSTKLK
jgi:hypothetical protein